MPAADFEPPRQLEFASFDSLWDGGFDSVSSEALANESLLSVGEAAAALGKSDRCVRQWCESGRLTGLQPGGRNCPILIPESQVKRQLGRLR